MKAPKMSLFTVVIAVIIIGVVYYFYLRKPKEPTGTNYEAIAGGAAPAGTAGTAAPAIAPPAQGFDALKVMKRGDKGTNVSYIQQGLNHILRLNKETLLTVDGDFGGKTEAALQKYLLKPTASYSMVKSVVIKKYAAAGKPSPYAASSQNNGGAAVGADLNTALDQAFISSIAGMF